MATKKKKVNNFCTEEPVINKTHINICENIPKEEPLVTNEPKIDQNKIKIQETVNFLASLVVFLCTAVCGISALFYFPIVLGILVFFQSAFNIYLLFNFTDFGNKITDIADRCLS